MQNQITFDTQVKTALFFVGRKQLLLSWTDKDQYHIPVVKRQACRNAGVPKKVESQINETFFEVLAFNLFHYTLSIFLHSFLAWKRCW